MRRSIDQHFTWNMAFTAKIDFNGCYEIGNVSKDLRSCSFNSVLTDGVSVPLSVRISENEHQFMPDVYNLSFGPLNKLGDIDDDVRMKHSDYSRVFSTIVFAAMTFLTGNPARLLGIDGSNNARAYLYYRCMLNNFEYLNQYFRMYGVNYYFRALRKNLARGGAFPVDVEDVLAVPERIKEPMCVRPERLYNYFVFGKR